MERRLVLTGIAALAASPAFAQSSPPPATDAPPAQAPVAPPAALPPAPAMKMAPPLATSDASARHMKDTMAVGSLSLLASRIAAPKVKEGALKQFTTFEIAEQETIASILKAMMMPGAPATGTVTAPTDAELTMNLEAKDRELVGKLHEMKAGVAFEREYVKAEIEGHKALLRIQEAYLQAPDNVDEANVAKLAKGMIVEHLALLGDIEKQLG